PYAPVLVGRVTGVKTPYAEIQLAGPGLAAGEAQFLLEIQRDLTSVEVLDDLVHGGRFLDLDCYQRAIESGGLKSLSSQDKQVFILAHAFLVNLWPVFSMIQDGRRKGYDSDALKSELKPMAQAFLRLLD